MYRRVVGVGARSVVWRGQVRGQDDAAVDAIESGTEAEILSQTAGIITVSGSRVFAGCVLGRYVRNGPRYADSQDEMICQDAELRFLQLNPA